MTSELTTFGGLVNANPLVSQITTPEIIETVFGCNTTTVQSLGGVWKANTRKNITLYKKHGSLYEHFRGFGVNKAVIGVGAGPSFNKNKATLKAVYDYNLLFPLHEQPFIIVASNKMFKPLLAEGIYPHFVMLIDAGDALYPQLCEDIPRHAKSSILIAGLQVSPKITKQWDRQGGQICFFGIGDDDEKEWFKQATGHSPELTHIQQGGNVLNTLWILCHRYFGATTFMMVGNDLGFKHTANELERQSSFYADGDYRINILNKKDEAKDKFAWMGFDLQECAVAPGRYLYNLGLMGVSRQQWVYKTWLEVQAAVWADALKFMIFNCSEAGTLGVLAKKYSGSCMYDKDNWFLIDSVLPKRWLTTSLKRATQMFLGARQWATKAEETIIVAPYAGSLAAKTNGVSCIAV